MTSIRYGGTTEPIRRPNVSVLVSGNSVPFLRLAGIQLIAGLAGSRADFEIQQRDRYSFSYALQPVVVWLAHEGQTATRPVFRGYLTDPAGSWDENGDSETLTALSNLAMLDRTPVSPDLPGSGCKFAAKDVFGNPSGWSPYSILVNLFAPARVALSVGADIALGIAYVSALSPFWEQIKADVDLDGLSMRRAMEQILALGGGLGIRERHEATLTYLDIYDNTPPEACQQVTVAALGETVGNGANVQRIADVVELNGITSRALVYAQPKRYVVTVNTDDARPGAALLPSWLSDSANDTPATAYPSGDDSLLGPEELAVLAEPRLGTEGFPGFADEYSRVFRLFKLPEALRGWNIDPDLPAPSATGATRVPPQAFVYDRQLFNVDALGQPITGLDYHVDGLGAPLLETNPRQVKIERIDQDSWTVLLSEPATTTASVLPVAGEWVTTRARAKACLTISIWQENNRDGAFANIPLAATGILKAGLTTTIERGDLGVDVATGDGSGMLDTGGASLELDATWFDGEAWQNKLAASGAFVFRDDSAKALDLAQDTVFAAEQYRRTLRVRVPFACPMLLPGDGIKVYNRGNGTTTPPLRVTSLTIQAEDPLTDIVCSNIPPNVILAPRAARLSEQIKSWAAYANAPTRWATWEERKANSMTSAPVRMAMTLMEDQ